MIQISFQAWMPPLACGHLHIHLDLFTCALIVCMTFLLGVLQHMTFICYLTEYLTCLKFHFCKPKHMSFKMIFVPNIIFFSFIHLISYLKNCLFSVKNTFVFIMIFVANLIFFCFNSLWFIVCKLTAHHCTGGSKRPHTYYQT